MHGINHTSAETVIDAPVIGAGTQTGSQDILLAVTALYGRFIEPVATLERVAQMETLYHLVTDAAVAEVAQTHIAPLVGIGEIGLEMAQRKLVDRKHIVAGSLCAPPRASSRAPRFRYYTCAPDNATPPYSSGARAS